MSKNKIVKPDKIVLNDKTYLAFDSDIVLDKIKWIELDPKDFKESEITDAMRTLVQSSKYESKADVPPNNTMSVKESSNPVKRARAELMSNLYAWHRIPKINTRDDIAVENRVNEFLQISSESGELVTIEKLSLALGVTTSTLRTWKNGDGVSPQRKHLIEQCYELIHAFETTLAFEGSIDKTMYIFRSKNHYDMVDRKDVIVTQEDSLGEKVDLDIIDAEYSDLID